MSAARAIELFASDCRVAVFSAEIGTDRCEENSLTLHVYPRKSGPGFVWIVRGPMDLSNIDACVIDGGRIEPPHDLEAAVLVAVAELLHHAGLSVASRGAPMKELR